MYFSISDAKTLLNWHQENGCDAWFIQDLKAIKRLSAPQKALAQPLFENLDDLRYFVQGIATPLKNSAKHFLFGKGPLNPKLMIIADAPQSDEDDSGVFLKGPHGEFLENMLKTLGYTKEDIYTAYLLPYRMPNHFVGLDEEVARFEPFMHDHIRFVKPQKMLLFGGLVLKEVLKTETPIMQMKGQKCDYQGIEAIPFFHLHYFLKSPNQKKHLWFDLLKLRLGA